MNPSFENRKSKIENLLTALALTRTFREGGRDLHVLRGVDLAVHRGEMLAILGASGSGKSTLLHLLGGFDRPTSGSVTFEDQDIYQLPAARLDRYRNQRVGFVFQFYHLLPELTAQENVAIAAMINGGNLAGSPRKQRAIELLQRVGLGERLTHRPAKLSGGERQRVAIARALMNEPDLLLADEPTGNLDRATGKSILQLLTDLHRDGQTLVIVTHDEHVAEQADRVLRLDDGRLVG